MSDQTLNFSLPGLMEITRPELDRQRKIVRLLPHHVQSSHWIGLAVYGGSPAGALSYDGSLLFYEAQFLLVGSLAELLSEEIPWRVVSSEFEMVSVVMKFGRVSPIGDNDDYRLSSDPGVGEGVITITDATAWEFNAPRQPLPLDVGFYDWEIQVTDANGETRVCYVGTLLVTP